MVRCREYDSHQGEVQVSSVLTIAVKQNIPIGMIENIKGQFEKDYNVTIEVEEIEISVFKQKVQEDVAKEEGYYDIIMEDDPDVVEFVAEDLLLNLTQNGYKEDNDFLYTSRALGKVPYKQKRH